MKDEIKEILDKLQKVANKKTASRNALMEMKDKDYQLLLDYITNLQEENKRLKELCNKYEEEHNTAFKLWTMKMEEIPTYEEKKELQNRIDKAIEYIEKDLEENPYENRIEHTDLLNILQGKSDE